MFKFSWKKKAVKGEPQTDNHVDEDDDGRVALPRREWSELPQELLELLMSRLLYIDQINFRAACKSLHSIGSVPIPSGSQNKHMPWLLGIKKKESWFSCKRRTTSWSSSKLSDPTYKKTYTIDMSPLQKKIGSRKYLKVHESKSGWLLLQSSLLGTDRLHYLIMYSPFLTSNNLLELPALKAKKIILATFSDNNVNGWSFVVLSHVPGTSTIKISTSRWGDNRWVTRHIDCSHQFSPNDVKAWIYSQGLFYYAKKSGEVGSLSADGEKWSTLPVLGRSLSGRDVRMMRSDEGVLYICIVIHETVGQRLSRSKLCMYRLNLNLSSQPQTSATTWENLESLGEDAALFIGGKCKSYMKLISNTSKVIENKAFYLGPTNKANRRKDHPSNLSFLWTEYYGSFSKKTGTYIRLWVEPPDHIYQ